MAALTNSMRAEREEAFRRALAHELDVPIENITSVKLRLDEESYDFVFTPRKPISTITVNIVVNKEGVWTL